jgi:hypothetical protein
MPMPAAVVTPISTIADRDRSAGKSSRATAVASGTRPNPAPCSTRPARNAGNPAGSADSTQPASMTATAPTVVGRRSRPSPRRPISGVATAPASSVMVSVHCEAASETRSTRCTVGSSGVPRLATAVDWTARNTSTAASSRGEAGRRETARTEITIHGKNDLLMSSKTDLAFLYALRG